MLTDVERKELKAILQAYFPGKLPDETAMVWLTSLEHRASRDVLAGITAMAETAEFPSLKALKEAVDDAAAARVSRQREQDEARLLSASTERPVDRARASRILGRLVEAMRAKATAAEIEALVEREVRR